MQLKSAVAIGCVLACITTLFAAEPATQPTLSPELRKLKTLVAIRQQSVDSFKKSFADGRGRLELKYQKQLEALAKLEKSGTAEQQASAKSAVDRTKSMIDAIDSQLDPVLVKMETDLAALKSKLAAMETEGK